MRAKVAAIALLLTVAMPPHATAELRPTAREGADHAVPLYGELARVWTAPDDNPYAPGHRGLDVAAPVGSPVRASAPGVVSFAGNVAGNRSVTVDHGRGLVTSYSYLGEIKTTKGTVVALGDVVGTVDRGHADEDLPPHVHLSARRDGVYFDPIGLYIGISISDLISLTG